MGLKASIYSRCFEPLASSEDPIYVIESQGILADLDCEKEGVIERIVKVEGNAEEVCCSASFLSILKKG